MADGQKMSNYTPLASGEKDYFFSTGEGSVVAVGKVSSGQPKANRLVKLNEIAGDKLPSGGTEGQVLTKTSSGEAWANAPSELPSGGAVGQVLKKTSNGVEWGNSEVVKFSGTLNPDANPPNYSGMPSAVDVKNAIQAGKHVILSLDDTTGNPVQYFYTHSGDQYTYYFVGFPRKNAAGQVMFNRTYINAINTIENGPDSMGWSVNKYLFANWPLTDAGTPTGDAGDVLSIVSDQYGTKSMAWSTPSTELPSGGTEGQVLTKGSGSAVSWADAPGGGGGGYTVSTLTPTNAELTEIEADSKYYVINAANKSLIYLNLNSITDAYFYGIKIQLPEITATEYYDIIVQMTGYPDREYEWLVAYPNDEPMMGDGTGWFDGQNTECRIFGKKFKITFMASEYESGE